MNPGTGPPKPDLMDLVINTCMEWIPCNPKATEWMKICRYCGQGNKRLASQESNDRFMELARQIDSTMSREHRACIEDLMTIVNSSLDLKEARSRMQAALRIKHAKVILAGAG